MICPDCAAPLTQVRTAGAALWRCADCAGLAATLAVVRKLASPQLIAATWSAARALGDDGRACPSCRHAMREVDAPPSGPRVDICLRCELAWFDVGELEVLSDRAGTDRRSGDQPSMSAAAREMVARLQVDLLAERGREARTVKTWQELIEALWLLVRTSPL
jgi:Zn-finger nucleic acid-binding protein